LTKKYGDKEMPKLKNSVETPDDGTKRKERTPYHGAAFGVFSCLFNYYRKNGLVELHDEHRLSKEPLRIDIVVIKKNRDIELEPAWAKIFRGHNLVEYKSPTDKTPTLADFSKLMGYAWIYAAQEKVSVSDMTATLICAETPEKLFETLKKDFDYEIFEKGTGIYYITERGVPAEKRLAVQVMTQKSEPLLRAMDKKPLDDATVNKVAEFIAGLDEEGNNMLDCWFRAIEPENMENIHERRDQIMTRTEELHARITKEWHELLRQRQEGLQEGLQKGAMEVLSLLEKGYSPDDIKKMMQLT
jgi:hypothetical protein